MVASTDMLVESVHFDLRLTSWTDLGWKSLAVNLSDLAAMGATPAWAVVSLGLRRATSADDVVAFYQGMADLAGQSACTVAGGDTVSVPRDHVVNVTVWGTIPLPEAETVMRRDAGRPGDQVAVTGTLGGSAAGLFALQHSESATGPLHETLARVHARPQPQITAGLLARQTGVRCAMDVSDGLLADLEKLCLASGAGARVNASRLPVHPAAREAYPDRALAWAAGGGEDYQLLIVAPETVMLAAVTRLAAAGISATVIGNLASAPGELAVGEVLFVDDFGQPVDVVSRGWDHFGPEPE